MAHDLLSRIRGELQERMRALRPAVEEHDRLQDDLRTLQDAPEPPAAVDPEPSAALQDVPERPAAPEPVLASESPVVDERSASVTRLRVGRTLPRTRMVSPKVARLMHTPRRPALERRGVVRVGAARLDCLPDDLANEIDAEAELKGGGGVERDDGLVLSSRRP